MRKVRDRDHHVVSSILLLFFPISRAKAWGVAALLGLLQSHITALLGK